MELGPWKQSEPQSRNKSTKPLQEPKMSILAMSAPAPYRFFKNDSPWNATRVSSDSYPRTESKQVALPSIRQTFPDLHLESSLATMSSQPSSSSYKTSLPAASAKTSPPEYVHSPTAGKKRRRISMEDEEGYFHARRIPRLYGSPELPQRRSNAPHHDQPSCLSSKIHWAESRARTTSFGPCASLPASIDVSNRAEQRTIHPSLPPASKMDRNGPSIQRMREATAQPPVKVPGPGRANMAALAADHAGHQGQEHAYAFHHPSRFQSLSTSSIRSHDRAPFSDAGATFPSQYQDATRYGGMGIAGDVKQRKRRGNLPKETTDKLRAWFVAHLQHPYPTEDEKQELMRQTGLQMNQISNWFINARRRQLPTMINNARAESDAMNSRSSAGNGDGTVLASTEQPTGYGIKRDEGLPLSDGEGGSFDDDANDLRRPTRAHLERGSV